MTPAFSHALVNRLSAFSKDSPSRTRTPGIKNQSSFPFGIYAFTKGEYNELAPQKQAISQRRGKTFVTGI
jgi:hypothetical protein